MNYRFKILDFELSYDNEEYMQTCHRQQNRFPRY